MCVFDTGGDCLNASGCKSHLDQLIQANCALLESLQENILRLRQGVRLSEYHAIACELYGEAVGLLLFIKLEGEI